MESSLKTGVPSGCPVFDMSRFFPLMLMGSIYMEKYGGARNYEREKRPAGSLERLFLLLSDLTGECRVMPCLTMEKA